MKISLSQIKPSPRAVRTTWDEEALEELAQSIKEHGLIVPIKVRPDGNGKYEIVYGHRRVKALRRAGIKETDAIVEGIDDTDVLVQALIENVQREDMNPIDIAKTLFAIQEETGWSQSEMARRGIMKAKTISVTMALLKESESVQGLVERGARGGHQSAVGVISREHVTTVREAGLDEHERDQVLNKAATEGLGYHQTRQVADAIAAANTDKLRDTLLDEPYSDFIHDPDRIKDVVEKRGGIDPMTKRDRPKERVWPRAVADFLRQIKQMRLWVEQFEKAVDGGQVSPEGKPFVATRLKTLRNDINRVLKKLETK